MQPQAYTIAAPHFTLASNFTASHHVRYHHPDATTSSFLSWYKLCFRTALLLELPYDEGAMDVKRREPLIWWSAKGALVVITNLQLSNDDDESSACKTATLEVKYFDRLLIAKT